MSAQAVHYSRQSHHSHHSILALDIENFGTRPNAVQESLRRAMYEVFADAREQTGLLPDEDIVVEDRGDGFVVLFPATVSPILLAGSFVRALNDAMRFRVALHQGMAKRDARGWSGDAINTTCRLVDAPALRTALAAATKAHLVFIVSDEIYQGVVRHGHRTIDAAAYLPVDFEAKHGMSLRGWITTPGYPAPPGVSVPAETFVPTGVSAPTRESTAGGGHAAAAQPAGTNKTTHDPDSESARRRNPDRPTVTFKARTVNGDMVAGDKHVHGRARPKDRP
jgi:hypothetical protein